MICPAAAEESAHKVTATRGNVEETTLNWRGEMEAWIEYIANRCEEGVHVPDERRRGDSHCKKVGVSKEEDNDAKWRSPAP